MTDITYYFNSQYGYNWAITPDYMWDNILTNYASTSEDGDIENLDENTCPGTDLGTITKVEIRVYGYGDGNDRIDIKPIIAATLGDTYQTTPGTVADWGTYVDITSDSKAPPTWTWLAILNLGVHIVKETVSKGNELYCSKVEIRVTYTPTAGGVTRSYGYIFG